jgi:hypothetical protein
MKTMGSGSIALPFLTSRADGDELLASLSGRFILGKRAPGTYWTGGCVSLSVGLDAMEKRVNSCLYRESNHGNLACSQSLRRLSISGSQEMSESY